MQANVEILSGSERKITVKTSSERVDQAVEKRLKEMAPKAQLAGFRLGKVPMPLLRERFGESIRYEIIGQVIDETYREAILQEKLTPAGMPNIDIIQDKAGEPLEYQAIVEILPQVQLQELGSMEIENVTVNITPKDVDEMIQKLRRQRAVWSPVDRASQKGDKVTISFEGRQNGELFEGGAGKDVSLELGSGTAIPGFEEGFTGHKAGDSIAITLVFPADYHASALAGKPVDFKGTLHKVEEPELPALDEKFAEELGVKEGGIEQLRNTVLENMQRDMKQKVQGYLKDQVMEKILQLHPLDIPKVLVEEELIRVLKQEQAYMSEMRGGAKQVMPEPREELRVLARRRVHLGLVFAEFIHQYKITPDSQRIDKLITELAASYDNPAMIIQAYRGNKKLYQQLEEKVLEDQLIDQIVSQAKLLEKTVLYSEFKGFQSAKGN